MRLQSVVCFMTIAASPAIAQASSFVTPGSPAQEPASSIIVVSEPTARPTPSIVAIGNPEPDVADDTAGITVIRGGEIGGPIPAPAPESAPYVAPRLDPNDRGTPAKRNALRRQAAEEAARQDTQPSP